MSSPFPPMPPRDQLRIDDGDLVFRAGGIDDAQAIFDLTTNPGLQFMLDQDRPQSLEQLRNSLALVEQRDASGEPARGLHWIVELDNQVVGVFTTRFEMLDKNGGRNGLLLRSATWQAYFGPEFINQGIARRMKFGAVEDVVEGTFVRHFGVEQMVGWIDDGNESARAMVTAYGFEGPINHDHPGGLGFYRRPTRPLAD